MDIALEKLQRPPSYAVSSPSLWVTLIEPTQGGFARWLCVFSVGDFEGPFVPKTFETTEDEVLLLATQVLDGLKPEADQVELEAVISDELAINELLLQASQPFQRSTGESEKPVKKATKPRFSAPVAMEDVESGHVSGVPGKTRAQTSWSTGVWADLAKGRVKLPAADEQECQYDFRLPPQHATSWPFSPVSP